MMSNTGEDMVWEAKIAADTIASSADTIDCSASTVVASGDSIKILSATNITDGNSIVPYITWTPSTRSFAVDGGAESTNVDSYISSDEIKIEFKVEST